MTYCGNRRQVSKMQSIIAAVILIVSLALASPAVEPDGCTPSTKYYVAKYDDLPYVEPGPNPIPSPYNGLTYNIFQVTEPHLFIFPTSGNQYAMAFGGSGNISSVYVRLLAWARLYPQSRISFEICFSHPYERRDSTGS